MEFKISWEMFMKGMFIAGVVGTMIRMVYTGFKTFIGLAKAANDKLNSIESELRLIRQELTLKYEALDARVRILESKDSSHQ